MILSIDIIEENYNSEWVILFKPSITFGVLLLFFKFILKV